MNFTSTYYDKWDDIRDQTLLHLPCLNDKDMAMFIAAGFDVNAKDEKGLTPLYYQQSDNKIKMLIEAGADVIVMDVI